MSEPDHTAARLVAAAELLFAEAGEEATSLRAISRAARSNAAAVHYHFGGRDELLRAVIDRHLSPLHRRRFELLAAAVAEHGEPLPVPAIVEAVVRPDVELLASLHPDRVAVARLVGRAPTLPGTVVADLIARHFGALAARVIPLLQASVPEVDAGVLRERLRLVVATSSALLATAGAEGLHNAVGIEEMVPVRLGIEDVDEQVHRLVAFCAAGLSAPWTRTEPRTRLKRRPAMEASGLTRPAKKTKKR